MATNWPWNGHGDQATQSKHTSMHRVETYEILSRVDGGDWEPYREDNAVKVSQYAVADLKFMKNSQHIY